MLEGSELYFRIWLPWYLLSIRRCWNISYYNSLVFFLTKANMDKKKIINLKSLQKHRQGDDDLVVKVETMLDFTDRYIYYKIYGRVKF